MDEGSLGVHEIEFVVETRPCFSDGGSVAQHTQCTLYFSKITTWHNSWWLVVDSNLETSWAPINKLNGTFGLDGCNSSVDILGDDITTVQHTAGHVLAMTRIPFHHLVGWLEAGVCDLRY